MGAKAHEPAVGSRCPGKAQRGPRTGVRAWGELARRAEASGYGRGVGVWKSRRGAGEHGSREAGERGGREEGKQGSAGSRKRYGPGGRADAENEWAEAGPRPGRERAGRPRGPPRRKGREATTGRSLTRREIDRALRRAPLSRRRLLTALGGAPGPGRAAAAGPGAPPHLPLWRSREEPGDGGDGSLERGGQETRMFRVTAKGEGECQEVRAPRTCPAVRMRRAAAVQGKASTGVLSALLPHPTGKGRGPAGDRWSGARRAESQGARPRHTRPRPPLKWQRLRGPQHRRDWGLTVAVTGHRSTTSERDRGSELNSGNRCIPVSRT